MSPFKSQAQKGFMFSQHPQIANRWAKETPNMKSLPKKKGKTGKTISQHMDRMSEKMEPKDNESGEY